MLARFLRHKPSPQQPRLSASDLNLRVTAHYGIPLTSSIMAYDPYQSILAVGTLDGRIKVLGGDNIEALLVSSTKSPFKHLEFLHNMGHLISITNENDIQVWDLENRHVASHMQWESNITAFSIIQGSSFMYLGDESGSLSVLKYDIDVEKLLRMPYNIPAASIIGTIGLSMPGYASLVGILPQPSAEKNRVLIAYSFGLIILWDTYEDRVISVRGNMDLQLKSEEVSNSSNISGDMEEKEIGSLCWASVDGSVLAVGYIDGDIFLWNIISSQGKKIPPASSSSNVVKLQLSSANRRLPVIVLHWRGNKMANNHYGQLFVYGGDEVGSEESLTVLNLEWSSGLENLKCTSKEEIQLHGSFADMTLSAFPRISRKSANDALFMLTNPGQLHMYGDQSLSTLSSQEDVKGQLHAELFPTLIPLVDPYLSISKLVFLPRSSAITKVLTQIAMARKQSQTQTTMKSWPLTGGISTMASLSEEIGVEQLYVAGYQDGSVRIWDATLPLFSLLFFLPDKVEYMKVGGQKSSVSALDFSSVSGNLAVGSHSGLVRIYKLSASFDGNCTIVMETTVKVHEVVSGENCYCSIVLSLLKSPITVLQFSLSGEQLAVGCEDAQVTIFDLNSLVVLFRSDSVTGTHSAIVSMEMKMLIPSRNQVNSPKSHGSPESEQMRENGQSFLFIATRDAQLVAISGANGRRLSSQPVCPKKETLAISMHVVDLAENKQEIPRQRSSEEKLSETSLPLDSEKASLPIRRLSDMVILLCCNEDLFLYSLASIIEGDHNCMHRKHLDNPCCWSNTFSKDDGAHGLILLYQTGLIEIRSFPELEVIGESSLLSILRWNFKADMAKTVCSSNNGQIFSINGSELAVLSTLSSENNLRIPESLPCLHDKVLAAAVDAAMSANAVNPSSGFISGIIKGVVASGSTKGTTNHKDHLLPSFQELGSIFSKTPFSVKSKLIPSDLKDNELSIDDIDIDEDPPMESGAAASSSLGNGRHKNKVEEIERENLLGRKHDDLKPRVRTAEEIKSKYRSAGEASATAAQARDKLAQRGEKLQRISERTEELRSGAENFASMAEELVKTLEHKKWYHI